MITRRGFVALGAAAAARGAEPNYCKLVHPSPDRKQLVYLPDAQGNTIPDFSNCGYGGGGVRLPMVPVAAEVPSAAGDAGERIQAAIDRVSALPLRPDGFRGTVLLKRGEHRVGGSLRIAASGVVLRGEGEDDRGTTILATGKQQRAVIRIGGTDAPAPGRPARILDEFVPVGARSFQVDSALSLRPGDCVIVRRHGNRAWIHEIAMDRIMPRPGDPSSTRQWEPFSLEFDRVVTAVEGRRITLDAPITCAIESRWGGGEVARFEEKRIRRIGVEFLRGVSEFDRSVRAVYGAEKMQYFSDEAHAWSLLSIEHALDVWVSNVTALRFGFACTDIRRGKWVTVQDTNCFEMVSQLTGSRRYPFHIAGQLCLVQRAVADSARHDFVVSSRVCGPNVFLDCRAGKSYATSEPHHRWSVGGLYDSVKANIAIQDRQYMGTGHGWAGANYVTWNCEGSMVCQQPPTAQNWSIGFVGKKEKGAFPRPDGYWESIGRQVEPRSLFQMQLAYRLGLGAVSNLG